MGIGHGGVRWAVRQAGMAGEKFLEGLPDTDLAANEKLHRDIVKQAERLVRRIHKNDAVALQKYGLKPRTNVRVTGTRRKPARPADPEAKVTATQTRADKPAVDAASGTEPSAR
jgi:hypothetical protein